ncbi:MAG: glycosyltransferase family 2 protein [Cyanobacteriota bacterium]
MGRRGAAFAVLAVFKNEATNISEWVSHYVSQGAFKIVLVNNGSCDRWRGALERSSFKDVLIIKEDPRPHAQLSIYRDVLKSGVFADCKWLLVCDLDEFVYARNGYASIAGFLESFPLRRVGAIMLPWKNFGSSGHDLQPKHLRESFIARARVPFPEPVPGFSRGKYLCRVEFTRDIDIHHPLLKKGCYILSSGRDISCYLSRIYGGFAPNSESELEASCLHVNHYPIQSRSYFVSVKSVRGDAYFSDPALQVKNMAYFEKFDRNDIIDEELALLARREKSLRSHFAAFLRRFRASLRLRR